MEQNGWSNICDRCFEKFSVGIEVVLPEGKNKPLYKETWCLDCIKELMNVEED